MIKIVDVITPSVDQMDFVIRAITNAYSPYSDTIGSSSGLGCSTIRIRDEVKKCDLLCKNCNEFIRPCSGIDKHYVLGEADRDLLLQDKVGYMSYMMVLFTISGPSDLIRDFVNFDLFLDNCDDIFHTILKPHFIKLESVNYGGDIYQKCHVMINYPALSNMYTVYNHTGDKNWQDVCKWISSLPYSDLITSCAGD